MRHGSQQRASEPLDSSLCLDTLGTRYEQLVIDLTEAAYTEVVSPFGFSIPATAQNEPVSLYISDVRWE